MWHFIFDNKSNMLYQAHPGTATSYTADEATSLFYVTRCTGQR